MLYSKLFGKTEKNVKKDISATSHKLLYQAGFIRESTAGRYYYLPLGQRVRNKIIDVVRKNMDEAGSQELLAPVLHPLELWEETNRNNEAGFELMLVEDRRGAKFALGGTAEEMMVDLVRQFRLSYKDLPFNIYQLSTKFRDELRARSGLLRVREFTMKDAYSFHTNEEDFKKEYENMTQTYSKIYEDLGLKTYVVGADNGYIGGDYCHEFITDSEIGESTYFVTKDNSYIAHEDIAEFIREPVNQDQEIKDLETIEQPKWVKTMEDNVKHYGVGAENFLKNVVYKHRTTGDIIIAVIRGDLDVNKTKLEHVIDAVGQLEDATEDDLKAIGTKTGYVHSWGHEFLDKSAKVRYVGDLSLKTAKNFIGGQKTDTTDTKYVNYGRDFECEIVADIALANAGLKAPNGKELIEKRGIEVGNIFQLGCHYSSKMANAFYTDADGTEKPFYMGCYGIGIDRTLGTIAEVHNDEYGIIWPENIAPYKVHLVGLNLEDSETFEKAQSIYKQLLAADIEVLFDDRIETRAGEKFKDADLIGCPYRIVVSKKTEGELLEFKKRIDKESSKIELSELIKKLS